MSLASHLPSVSLASSIPILSHPFFVSLPGLAIVVLVNAVEHGEGRPLEIRVADDEHAVAVSVRDFGVGLRPGEQTMVFNRFWRADPARARTTGGTGLGWDEDWQAYVVEATVAGQPARFVVSTVAGVVVDAVAAERLGLALGPVVDSDGGPTGTVVEVRPVESSWALDLDGRTRTVAGAVSWDVYSYADRPRPSAGRIDGFLGCELLVQERAVLDFGRGRLALRP